MVGASSLLSSDDVLWAVCAGAYDSLVAVDDPTPGEVVRAQLDDDPVLGEDADVVLSHLAADVRQDLVSVRELDPEHGVRERLDDRSLDLDCAILLRHVLRVSPAHQSTWGRSCSLSASILVSISGPAPSDATRARRAAAARARARPTSGRGLSLRHPRAPRETGTRRPELVREAAWERHLPRSGPQPKAGTRIPSASRRARPPSSAVRTHGPSGVRVKVCSKCAERWPSWVTTVQPSSSCRVCRLPRLTMGSTASTSPGTSSGPRPALP